MSTSNYSYHVTTYPRLKPISKRGLIPDQKRGIGPKLYNSHRKGAVFLTEWAGVFFWYDLAEEWSYAHSDSPAEEGIVPIVLRVHQPAQSQLVEDALGTAEARCRAWKCLGGIPNPADIEVWSGDQWVLVKDAFDFVDPKDGVEDNQLISWMESPLMPTGDEAGRERP